MVLFCPLSVLVLLLRLVRSSLFLFRCVASASYGTWVGGATSSATLSN